MASKLGTQPERSTFRLVILFCILIVVGVVGYWLFNDQVARHDFDRLLHGDNDVAITLVQFSGQGRKVTFDDEESLRYLSEMLRHSQPRKSGPGLAYYVHFTLSTGRCVPCGFYVPQTKTDLTINFSMSSIDDEGVMYFIELRPPLPDALSKLIGKLAPTEKS
jgi:hypothetical protein